MRGRWRGMKARSPQSHTLTPAQRGQIVQRVIVDGWSTAAVARAAVAGHLAARPAAVNGSRPGIEPEEAAPRAGSGVSARHR